MVKKKRSCPLFLGGYLSQGGFFMNVLFCPLFKLFLCVGKFFGIIFLILSISKYDINNFYALKFVNVRNAPIFFSKGRSV